MHSTSVLFPCIQTASHNLWEKDMGSKASDRVKQLNEIDRVSILECSKRGLKKGS